MIPKLALLVSYVAIVIEYTLTHHHVILHSIRRGAKILGETSGLVDDRFRNEIRVPANHPATENNIAYVGSVLVATLVSLPGSGFWNVPDPEGCVAMLKACRIQETLGKHMAKCKQTGFGLQGGLIRPNGLW